MDRVHLTREIDSPDVYFKARAKAVKGRKTITKQNANEEQPVSQDRM